MNISLEELRRLIRKIEFNKTEYELLVELVDRAQREGEREKERITHINILSREIYDSLEEMDFIHVVDETKPIEDLKKVPLGCVDGSFQVVGGLGGKWYAVYGVAQVIAKSGFTLKPIIIVGGDIRPLEAVDEGEARRKAEIIMMMGETKSIRMVAQELETNENVEGLLLIDGPIIDPPLYSDKSYIADRVDSIEFCSRRNVKVIGFVKRIKGNQLINYLKIKLKSDKLTSFTNDLDLLARILFHAVKRYGRPVYTHPVSYDECYENEIPPPYKYYKEKGMTIYYSYYKPNLRGKVFRIEYASFEELEEEILTKIFQKVISTLNKVWTLPGIDEPLPIMLAHNKCNVRKGAAETLYYEIISRSLGLGEESYLWLEDTTTP